MQFRKRRIATVKLIESIAVYFALIFRRIYNMFRISYFSSLFFVERILIQCVCFYGLVNIFPFNTQACGFIIVIILKFLNCSSFIKLCVIISRFLVLN